MVGLYWHHYRLFIYGNAMIFWMDSLMKIEHENSTCSAYKLHYSDNLATILQYLYAVFHNETQGIGLEGEE